MRRYTDEQINDYEEGRRQWLRRGDDLTDVALSYPFKKLRAEQFSREGFVRRLNYLDHAMCRLADIYPPNLTKASRGRVRDAELLVQSFVMNVFGAIDNLAWVWVLERGITRPNGTQLRRAEVVFDGPQSRILVESLTPALNAVVSDASDWFKALRTYRDGVAHQIPIYIPRLLNEEEAQKSAILSVSIHKAISARNHKLMGDLLDERNNLGDYGAFMALSGEQSPMMLHPQMVCDLATVVNFGETLFSELNSGVHEVE
jgi:hypothetical protein